jgi:hypothetical protein
VACGPALAKICAGVGFVACLAVVAEIWGSDDLRWRRFEACSGAAELGRLGFG